MKDPTPPRGRTRSVGAELAELIDRLVADRVEAALASRLGDGELVPHHRWPVASRRRAAELARSGEIPARKRGRLWLAKRADLEAWATSGAAPSPDATAGRAEPANDGDDTEAAARAAARRKRR